MTSHLDRIRKHMSQETTALVQLAERARQFDNNTNKGTEAEEGIRKWVRARYAPDFTVSSGEIIDSFDTNASLASRQQDGILHANDAEANRFVMPSGMRLVPIESVAAVVEVKLDLDKTAFDLAEQAAQETARLRLRAARHSDFVVHKTYGDGVYESLMDEQYRTGVASHDPSFRIRPVTFALFGFGGVKNIEAIRGWLSASTAISVVCCLGAGCISVNDALPGDGGKVATPGSMTQVGPDDAMWHFSESLSRALGRHRLVHGSFHASHEGYAQYTRTVV